VSLGKWMMLRAIYCFMSESRSEIGRPVFFAA
jgi:hypothetical protein